MSPLLLGIDAGGTTTKAAVFDARGRELAVAGAHVATSHPRLGWVERDPDAVWRAAIEAIRRVLAIDGVEAGDIACIACTGYGNGGYFLDARGQSSAPAVVSTDARAGAMARALQALPDAGWITGRTGQPLRAPSTLALLVWLAREAPEIAARTAHVLLCKDFLRYRLTGELASDLSDLSGAGLLNFATGEPDEEVLRRIGLAGWQARLPAVLKSSAIAGAVTPAAAALTGLVAGTPVAAGAMDVEAVTLASGVADASAISICAGTWSINMVSAADRVSGRLPVMQCRSQDGSRVLLVEGSPTSATNLAWLAREIMADDPNPYDKAAALVAGLDAAASDLVYLPFIHGGEGQPRASFVGLGQHCGQAHLARAVFEGVAFQHRHHVDDLLELAPEAGAAVARLSGGAARSDVWMQLFADILERPVVVARGQELGALGSAICAAVAVGLYTDYPGAIAAMTAVDRRFEPNAAAVEILRQKRSSFRAVEAALEPVWPALGRAR